MMYLKFFLVLLSTFLASASISAQKYRTDAYSDMVKTLRVCLADDVQALPYIELGNGAVEINFDILGNEQQNYTYTLTHCNADWTASDLVESDYMTGFQHRIITDYAISINTTMEYVNYRIEFPNEDVTFKISGNYAVQVFPENDDEPILCACFSVVEPAADIDIYVSSQTDRGMNNYFQQVNFTLNCSDIVKSPLNDLKVYVRQNERADNEARLVKPLHIQNRKLTYEHVPSLIFEAGNEYRRFEMTTRRFRGYSIASIDFHDPYYHVSLFADANRSSITYQYVEDINGRIFTRTLDGTDYDYEADYYLVHFFLPAPHPFDENIFILSQAFNNILDDRSLMEYSEQDGGYVKTALLKEGYYNYLYVTRKNSRSPASPAAFEGNFYQTENEYRVLVYFRRAGDRFDRLIATKSVNFR